MSPLEQIELAQQAARANSRPSDILRLLLGRIQPRFEGHVPWIDIEACLVKAFNIPLREVRDIEGWVGFHADGNMDDDAIDQLLEPWLLRYRQRVGVSQ